MFDLDGTILDSMPYWDHLGAKYLEKKGIEPPKDLDATLMTMTLLEGAGFLKKEFDLSGTAEEIMAEFLYDIKLSYQFEIPPKTGMKQIVRNAKKEADRVVLFTSSDAECVKGALKRLGLLRAFDAIYTADQIGIGKDQKEAFLRVCELESVSPEDVKVYDDAHYAIKAAKEAGCYVVAVYDATMEEKWNDICKIADETIKQ